MSERIPVTIVTGFLGAGKTTLLRQLLKHSKHRLGVIVNEFGTIGLDGDLIQTCGFCPDDEVEKRVVELRNGCLCCTVQDDFLPAMLELLSHSNKLDGILIETSGLALPKPLLQALNWPSIRTKVYVNGVVTVVDGESLATGNPVGDPKIIEIQRKEDPSLDHLTSIKELFCDQLEVADLVLITRSDICSVQSLEQVKVELATKVRKATPLIPIALGNVNPSLILELDHPNDFNDSNPDSSTDHHHHHFEMKTCSLRFECDLDKIALENHLKTLVVKHKILRVKGRCWLPGKSIPLQLQMVGSRLNTWYEKVPESAWTPQLNGIDLVFLGLNALIPSELRASLLENCLPDKD